MNPQPEERRHLKMALQNASKATKASPFITIKISNSKKSANKTADIRIFQMNYKFKRGPTLSVTFLRVMSTYAMNIHQHHC